MSPRAWRSLGILALIFIAAVAVFVWLAPYYSTHIWWFIRGSLFVWVSLFGLAVVGLACIGWAASKERYNGGVPGGVIAAALAIFALAFGATIFYWAAWHPYGVDREYSLSVNVATSAPPTLGQRAPYQVASAQARSNLGDVTGEIHGTAYLPTTDAYGTLVEARGWLTGYETLLTQAIPLTGRGTGTTCKFDDAADARLGGWFGHNLGRLINEQRRWVNWDDDDVYAFCAGDVPKVVVPLKEQRGLMTVTEVPAGVALYDGRTGGLSIVDNPAGLPGPSYPLSIAADQRESTHALGTLGDYVFGRAGWDQTDEDTNSSNATEFVLPTTDHQARYVTPLTARGAATAISAMSVISGAPAAGELARLDVFKLDPSWVSLSAIDQRIRADYQDIPNWQALRIMEIAPVDGGHWVATIGNDQNVLYRVTGTGTLTGGDATCLHRADGSLIRCGTLADVNGAGVGTQYGQRGGPGAPAQSDLIGRLDEAQRAIDDARKALGG